MQVLSDLAHTTYTLKVFNNEAHNNSYVKKTSELWKFEYQI